jgi:hypothetical protein
MTHYVHNVFYFHSEIEIGYIDTENYICKITNYSNTTWSEQHKKIKKIKKELKRRKKI